MDPTEEDKPKMKRVRKERVEGEEGDEGEQSEGEEEENMMEMLGFAGFGTTKVWDLLPSFVYSVYMQYFYMQFIFNIYSNHCIPYISMV